MVFLLIYVLLLVVLYKIAKKQGKDAIRVVFWSFFLTPIVGVIILVMSEPNHQRAEEYQAEIGGLVKCSECAELIKSEAKKCKHCGSVVGIAA